MAQRLRPAKMETLVVWLLPDPTDSGAHLQAQLALFEKKNPGVHVYLRRADAQEFLADQAVPPDLVLFAPGALAEPSRRLLPLAMEGDLSADVLAAGQSGGAQYALPLWFAPSVLAVPTALLPMPQGTPAPSQSSLFSMTPPPGQGIPLQDMQTPDASQLPWKSLVSPGALAKPQGFALQQLLSMCPSSLREALVASLTQSVGSPAATSPSPGRGAPKKTPPPAPSARVLSLAAYRRAVAAGQDLAAFPMTPAATENLLLLGLCRDSPAAQGLLRHLLSPEAQNDLVIHGLLPVSSAATPFFQDGLTAALAASYRAMLLFPNAFEHTPQEILSLCLDGFTRRVDPAETLLRLR